MEKTSTQTKSVTITTSARLHMGFIDMHGGLGRRFGSIGLFLDAPKTVMSASIGEEFKATGLLTERVLEYAQQFAVRAGIQNGAHFDTKHIIPEHAGLGSGTQLALAVGTALARLYKLPLNPREIAAMVGRGMRSGVGVGVFEHGGLVVDGGHGANTVVPPILARLNFPEAWRVLLVLDSTAQGVHGQEELQAFTALPEFPAVQAAHIARLLLMQALPAVIEQDLGAFGGAMTEIQELVGEHFAPMQGGGHYASVHVATAMQWLQNQGVTCVGQSSWGPTGFAVVADQARAKYLCAGLRQATPSVEPLICRVRNKGAVARFSASV